MEKRINELGIGVDPMECSKPLGCMGLIYLALMRLGLFRAPEISFDEEWRPDLVEMDPRNEPYSWV